MTVCNLCAADTGFVLAKHLQQDLCLVNLLPDTTPIEHDALLNAKFDSLWVLDSYRYPLTFMIPALKFHGQQDYADLLARWFVLYRVRWMTVLPQHIIAVPLHWRRHWQRGYNQAELIAQALSRYTHIPILDNAIKRRRYTRPQSELTQSQRSSNIHNAFWVNQKSLASIQSVVLIDDVITTGSTLNDLCSAMYKVAPHLHISVWCMGLSVLT